MRRFLICCWLILLLLNSRSVTAQVISQETISQIKKSTAMVVLGNEYRYGSAFCIDSSGYFVTSESVVAKNKSGKIKLVLNSGEADSVTFETEVLNSDKEVGLALLRAVGTAEHKFVPAKLGGTDDLIETQDLVVFGYPYVQAKAPKEKLFPSVIVRVGRVSSLAKVKGKLDRIHINTQLNPGTSGGPVLNPAGEIVGIVELATSRGIDRGAVAMPISILKLFLAKPELNVASPSVPFKNRHEPLDLDVRVVRFFDGSGKLDISVEVGETKVPFVATQVGESDIYRARVVPVPPSETGPRVPIAITFSDGAVRCLTPERKITLDENVVQLSTISRIERKGDGGTLHLKDGRTVTGNKLEVGELKADFGEYVVTLDGDRANDIAVYSIPVQSNSVAFRVVARLNGEEVATTSGELSLKFEPVDTGTKNKISVNSTKTGETPKGEASFSGKTIYRFPKAYEQYSFAAGGRYIVFHVKKDKKLLVMDVLTGKTVGEIPGIMDDALIAAGTEKLVIVLPGQKLMQRWSLDAFEREKVAQLPGKGTTVRALMGASSHGPLLLNADDATLVDLETMKPIETIGDPPGAGNSRVGISYDGQTVVSVGLQSSSSPYVLSQIKGNTITTIQFRGKQNPGFAWPTSDGTLITLPWGELFDANAKPVVADWFHRATIFPTVDPRYFLSASFATRDKNTDVIHLSYCTTADRRIIHTVVGMEEFAPKGNTNSRNAIARSMFDRHIGFHYIPWAKLLIILPVDRKQVILQRFDLMEALNSTGVDYLFVDSVPPTEAFKGQTFDYQIAVKSKRGGIKYKLESAPDGMKISEDGLLTWHVPTDFFEEEVQIIVTISDADKQDIFHSLQMAVRDLHPR